MNDLVIMHDQQAVTTSLKVAETFEKNHQHVLEAIVNLTVENSTVKNMFADGTYTNSRGREYRMIYMNRDGFTLLAMGFTGAKAMSFKLEYIQAFNQMEKAVNELPQTPEERLALTMQVASRTVRKVEKLDERVTDIEENAPIAPGEYNYIAKQVSKAVNEYVAVHHLQLDSKQRGLLYHDINGGLNDFLGIKTRSQLRKKDFDNADDFIANWQPSTATLMKLRSEGKEGLK